MKIENKLLLVVLFVFSDEIEDRINKLAAIMS